MKLNMGIVASLLVILTFTGCGIKTADYSVSAENVQELRNLGEIKIGIGSFSAKNNNETMIMCRLSEPIETPNDEPFEKFIEKAFKDELIISGLYDKNANIQITGHLKEIYGSSVIGNAFWSYDMTISSSNGKSFQLESRYEYGSSFGAYAACENMGSSFVPSVKKLIKDIITHPKFKDLLDT